MTDRELLESAVKTLEHLGYTYHGGEFWKPPLGKYKPKNPFDEALLPDLKTQIAQFEYDELVKELDQLKIGAKL